MRTPILMITLVLLAACTSSKLGEEWRDPGFSGGPFAKVMVIGASDTFEDRVLYEDTIAGLLRSGGTEVLTSHEHFARDVEMNRANVEPVVKRENVDGVLLTFFLAEAEFEGYQHANTMGRDYYIDRYQMAMDYARAPGFNSSEGRIYLASSIYDVASGKEIWSAISETSNPRQDSGIIKSVAPVLAAKIRDEGLVR